MLFRSQLMGSWPSTLVQQASKALLDVEGGEELLLDLGELQAEGPTAAGTAAAAAAPVATASAAPTAMPAAGSDSKEGKLPKLQRVSY